MAKKGQKFRSYSPEFKSKAVHSYNSGMSARDVAKCFGLPDHSYILRWVKDSKSDGHNRFQKHSGQRRRINLGKARSKKPELVIKWLEAEVALLKKIVAWERGYARRKSSSLSSEN